MTNNVLFDVGNDFAVEEFVERLASTYKGKEYNVNTVSINESYVISVEKDVGGINMLLGMDEGIKVNVVKNDGMLSINFTDAEWTGKIIGACVGCLVCFIPLITAIIGILKQLDLPKNIATDSANIISMMQK